MPPASKNWKFAILERRKRVSDMYLRGQSQWQIARELGIGQATASRDLEALRVEWRKASSLAIDAIQLRELAKIDLIESEAWAAWDRSKENKERTTKERASGESSACSKVVVVNESRLPDSEFLKTVLQCIDKRCEILGLDAATNIKHEGEFGSTLSEADKAGMIGGIVARLEAMEYDREHEDDAGGGPGDPGPGADLSPGRPDQDGGG